MDCGKYYERVIKGLIERQNLYAMQILAGAKSFEEYRSMCGRYVALREAEEIARKVYKEMSEPSMKLEKELQEYGNFQ